MKVYAQDGEFELTPELVRALVATYPSVNVRRELERMYLWTLKNAARRWTNPVRGIEAWLKREARKIAARKESERQQVKRTEVSYLKGVPTKSSDPPWWATDEGTLTYGRQKGVNPKLGETMANYRQRLRAA